MMKTYMKTTTGIFFIIFVIYTAIAFAAPEKATCPRKCPYVEKNADTPCLKNLSDEQKQQFISLRQKHMDEIKMIQAESLEKRTALREELSKPTPDPGAARKLQKAISKLDAKLEMKKVDFILGMKKINPAFTCMGMGGMCCMTNPHKGASACPAMPGKEMKKKYPHSNKVY